MANHPEEAGQELSSILWAFASFVVVQRPLVTTFSETLLQRIDEFSPQSLMMTAWSLSTLGMSGWSQMRVIADAARPRLAEFNELWIGSILWSIASCPVEEEEELERKRYLVSLSSAPVLHPLGQWRGQRRVARDLAAGGDTLDDNLWPSSICFLTLWNTHKTRTGIGRGSNPPSCFTWDLSTPGLCWICSRSKRPRRSLWHQHGGISSSERWREVLRVSHVLMWQRMEEDSLIMVFSSREITRLWMPTIFT